MRKKQLFQLLGVALAVIVPAGVIGQQALEFRAGEVLTATKLNELVSLATQATNAALEAQQSSASLRSELALGSYAAGAVAASALRIEAENCAATATGSSVDCTCRADEVAIGGGACTGSFCGLALEGEQVLGAALVESLNAERVGGSRNVWRLSCENLTTGARISCGTPHALCLRVSP
jgi:hypothetical protein